MRPNDAVDAVVPVAVFDRSRLAETGDTERVSGDLLDGAEKGERV